ncbi:MAG: hypothetical protein Tp133SUR523431_9 [Prokaryotic dsDNA virus sp.]|nr:MAG: hypothetical protein Tp133SUR523431_9 [Prokaryotic dsDNA virus sp.]|tara:strand:+ start:55 stop:381 length:327 start_codon:yes stop_codon:yes gene_type:complete
MSTLINASIKASELKKIDKSKIIKGEKDSYIPVTISVNDESKYGKNVSISIAQSKEERDAKADKHFLGNGSVIWTDGNIVLGKKDENSQSSNPTNATKSDSAMDDLPF